MKQLYTRMYRIERWNALIDLHTANRARSYLSPAVCDLVHTVANRQQHRQQQQHLKQKSEKPLQITAEKEKRNLRHNL